MQDQASGAVGEAQDRAKREAQNVKSEADATDDPNAKKDVAKGNFKDRLVGIKVLMAWAVETVC